MSEIALNQKGERIALHPKTKEVKWSRFNNPGKPGGAAKVCDARGLQLFTRAVITEDDALVAFRHQPGRYRGVQVDENRKEIEGAEVLYIDVQAPDSEPQAAQTDARDHVIIELARANARTSETLIEQLGPILLAAAGRIETGAHAPREVAPQVVQVPTVVEVESPPGPPAGPWGLVNQMLAGAGPALGVLINHYVLSKMLGLRPDQIAALGIQIPGMPTVPATPPNGTPPPTTPPPANDAAPGATSAPSTPAAPREPIDPNVQLAAVEQLLTPDERTTLIGHLRTLNADEITTWRIRLCSVSAVEAAATIRAELAAMARRQAQAGGAS